MKKFLALLPVLCVVSVPAEAGYEANHWSYCNVDADCVVLMGTCDFTAANRDLKNMVNKHYADLRARTRCKNPPSPEPKFANCVQGLCAPSMSQKSQGVSLGPEAMTSWTRHKDGIKIKLTQDGTRELAELAKANPGKRIGLYVDGALIATLPEAPEGNSLVLSIGKDEISKTMKLLESATVCNDAKVCSLTNASLKPIKE